MESTECGLLLGLWLYLDFVLDSELVHTSAGPAGIVNQLTVVFARALIICSGGSQASQVMTYVDGSVFVEEFFMWEGGKHFGKVTSILMMKGKNTIVIKTVYDYLEEGIRAVVTTVAQRE